MYVYWDNSNIFISAKSVAAEREGEDARFRVRINFQNLLKLAHASRPIRRIIAAGSVPPELKRLWQKMEENGVSLELFNRHGFGEQQVPAIWLQLAMTSDVCDYEPGIAVLITGDGANYDAKVGFCTTLQRMYKKGWQVEVLSWDGCCNAQMRRWVMSNGTYVSLDHYYLAVTFLEPKISDGS